MIKYWYHLRQRMFRFVFWVSHIRCYFKNRKDFRLSYFSIVNTFCSQISFNDIEEIILRAPALYLYLFWGQCRVCNVSKKLSCHIKRTERGIKAEKQQLEPVQPKACQHLFEIAWPFAGPPYMPIAGICRHCGILSTDVKLDDAIDFKNTKANDNSDTNLGST